MQFKKIVQSHGKFFHAEVFAVRFAVAVRSAVRICHQNLGINELQPVVMVSHISTKMSKPSPLYFVKLRYRALKCLVHISAHF